MLSFVVLKKEDETFISSCIHLRIAGYGKTDEKAIVDMMDGILRFLHESFGNPKYEESRWYNIYDSFKSNASSSILWDKYHAIQIRLAERGISTDRYSELENKNIKEVQKENLELKKKNKELRNKIKELLEERYDNMVKSKFNYNNEGWIEEVA